MPTDVPGAKAAVYELGYTPTLHLNEAEQAAHLASGSECPFDGPLGNNLLEIQWRVLPTFLCGGIQYRCASFSELFELTSAGVRSVH